jgi:hypothetical protein
MPPAVPGPYVDRAPPEDEDCACAPLRRTPSSGILFVVHPMDDGDGISPGASSEFRISSPPAYSERQ